MDAIAEMQNRLANFFPDLLGVRVTRAEKDAVGAELTVREELCTVPGILHGGAVMAFADTLGAVGTMLNLAEGQGTTTIESKTNFFAPARTGTTITAECLPLHRGRNTMVWQTTVRGPDGRMLAQVTQTQYVIQPRD